jgi:hypothetical protein
MGIARANLPTVYRKTKADPYGMTKKRHVVCHSEGICFSVGSVHRRGIRAGSILRGRILRFLCVLLLLAATTAAMASEYHGLVTFNGLPAPGVTITVTQAGKKYVTVSDTQGFYSFPKLADGPATVEVDMTGFSAIRQEITVAPDAPMGKLELKLMSLDQIRTELKPVLSAPFTEAQARIEPKVTAAAPKPKEGQPAAPAPPPEEAAQRATDGLLVNGSVNNAATSQFTLGPRFGNTASGKSLYTYGLFVRGDTSALDATPYSLTGVNTGKPNTSQITGGFSFGGPLKIPHVLRNGPNIFLQYARTQNSVATTVPGLMPTLAQRSGVFPYAVYDPLNQLTYQPGTAIPISSQAQALLNLYPLPNIPGNLVYNYQAPLVNDTHQDAVNSNASKTIGRKNQVSGTFAAQSTRTSNQTLLNFVDSGRVLGLNTSVNWNHTVNARLHWNLGYGYSRQSTRSTPFWQNRENVAGVAGITGDDQQPAYWGPPTLNFTGGLSSLTDAQSSFSRNQTHSISPSVRWSRTPHNITVGFDFRRQEYNYLQQANPRGTFTFTGAATAEAGAAGTGSDVADFLLGVPDTSSVGFGNADKYLRQSVFDAYANDDWRVNPQLTINAGVRWEYGAPVREIKDRLANLDVASGYSAVATVTAQSPRGPLTGQSYPSSLLRPDRTGIEPRLGLSWRPIPGSSLIVGAGYGITYDTSAYQGLALNMAQQAPFSVSLVDQNSAACPLTLVTGFLPCATTPDTFGVDPNFRVGYLQTWNLKLQRDLPHSLQMVATYLGNKGTRGAQLFLPNTNPAGAVNPCPSCPSSFEYLTSTGDSTRESLQLQLRRRLTSGFTASALYTWSKSIDDDSALGGQGAATQGSATIAQDWRNLRNERGLSNFDQRNLLSANIQYTTGMGKSGGTLLNGWRGRVYKEWTFQSTITYGSGLPETPLNSATIVAAYSSVVRPNVTGAPEYTAGGFVNRAAYTTPAAGQWGNARRNSITGPDQFSLNAAMVRTFRLTAKVNLDSQVQASNLLNHVVYTTWNTNINSTNFGLPAGVNAMRDLQILFRLRF